MTSEETLATVIGSELLSGEYDSDRAYKFKDVSVVAEYRNFSISPSENKSEYPPYKPWLGNHKFVHFWVELSNRYAVGRNQNPAKGLSFPVVKMPSQSLDERPRA